MTTLKPNMLSLKNSEPHVFDLHLAQELGFDRMTSIRVLIDRNAAELETYGTLHRCAAKSTGGRPGRAYYLNEAQALVLCALSRTPKAAGVRKLLIDVFMAWREKRKTVPVKAHNRSAPTPAPKARFYRCDLECYPDGTGVITLTMPAAAALAVCTELLRD